TVGRPAHCASSRTRRDQGRSARAPRAEYPYRFHLDQQFRHRERAYLDQGRTGERPGEELPASAPDLFAAGDVGDEDRDFDDIVHPSAGSLDQMLDLPEDGLRL